MSLMLNRRLAFASLAVVGAAAAVVAPLAASGDPTQRLYIKAIFGLLWPPPRPERSPWRAQPRTPVPRPGAKSGQDDEALGVARTDNNARHPRGMHVLAFTTWKDILARKYSIHVHAPNYDVIALGDVPHPTRLGAGRASVEQADRVCLRRTHVCLRARVDARRD